jgi:hypothetical protein
MTNMKKFLFALIALTVFAGSAHAFDPVVCDPQRSALCSGLIEWWPFGETADSAREGAAAGALLLEPDGVSLDPPWRRDHRVRKLDRCVLGLADRE